MENIRGARLRKFELKKIVLGVRMHFRHINLRVCVFALCCSVVYVMAMSSKAFDNSYHVKTLWHTLPFLANRL